MADTRQAPAARVFSYIRFSTPEQSVGDSERRQLDEANRWAEKHGFVVDESFRLTDRGKSGFHGTHRKEGALGRFLELVEKGKIPDGSILLVENIDRLSREDFLQAFETVSRIVTSGITIQTLTPFAEYNRESLKGGMIWQLVGQMQRAHEESQRKSDFGQANWKRKRELARDKKRILTRRVPNWLTVNSDGQIIANPTAVASVQTMFRLKLEGFGGRAIAIKLNAMAPWKPERGWRDSYIKKTLKNRAVLGEYQPHQRTTGKRLPCGPPIPDYYPPVVSAQDFYAVQELFNQNRGKGGRRDRVGNLYTHLVKCAYCGGTMHYVDKGDSPKGGQYLRCDNGYRGNGCARHTIRYAECEAVILENCPNLRPEQVLPDPDKAASLCLVLSQRIQGKKAELGDIERQAENLVDMIASTSEKPIRKRYQDRISKLDARKIALAGELQNDERKLATAERGQKSFSKWTADLKTLQKALAAGDVDVRRKLQSHLREFIDRIEVFANGHRTEYDSGTRDGEDLALTIEAGISTVAPEFAASREFYEFSNYITKRRMSKEGRFLRIHFKSGAQVTLVPEGSLASGFELKRCANPKREPDWHWKSPDVDRLWGEFMGEPKKRGRRAKLVTTC